MDVTWIVLNNKDKKDYDTDGHENNGVKYKSLIICTVEKCEEKIALKCLRRNYCHVKDTLMQISKASNTFRDICTWDMWKVCLQIFRRIEYVKN